MCYLIPGFSSCLSALSWRQGGRGCIGNCNRSITRWGLGEVGSGWGSGCGVGTELRTSGRRDSGLSAGFGFGALSGRIEGGRIEGLNS